MTLQVDYRLGGQARYLLVGPEESLTLMPDELRKCAALLCYRTAAGVRLAGMAFFVGAPVSGQPTQDRFAVTARHVIDKAMREAADGRILLRLNDRERGADYIETEIAAWRVGGSDNPVNAAVLPWTPPASIIDSRTLPISLAASATIILREGIGLGDQVFVTGLFSDRAGPKRNIPIVRGGHIAAMPDTPIETECGAMNAVLIESGGLGGLKGAPVFVKVPASGPAPHNRPVFYWLGLVHGDWRTPPNGLEPMLRDQIALLQAGPGLSVIVPAEEICGLIRAAASSARARHAASSRQTGAARTAPAAHARLQALPF